MSLPKAEDLTATWVYVEPGLGHILGSENDQGVTSQMYMNIYTAIYNYCVNKSRSSSSTSVNGNKFLGGAEIYQRLKEYLCGYVLGLKRRDDETFLEFYVRRWVRFSIGAGYLNNIFDYMNRYWVNKERTDGRRDVYDVNTLCTLTWRDYMFTPHVDTLVSELLAQIDAQRNNEIVNAYNLSIAIKSFVTLGIDTQDLKKPNLSIYVVNFEQPFVAETAKFYADESARYLAAHSVVDYLTKCETRLNEEATRANTYLHEHTKKPLTEALNKTLVEAHTAAMYSEFARLLEQTETEHIFKMYKLLNRIPATLDPLAVTYQVYVQLEGLKALEALKAADDEAKGVNPKNYVKTLITVYDRFVRILDSAFNNDAKFDKALDDACHAYINSNPIALPKPKGTSRTPELLAKYCDMFLKKSSKESETADMSVDDIMVIFKFINDKDAFETHYRRLLAKRLIHNTSSSNDHEELIIQKLQDENSTEYTSKMSKMFQDVQQSTELKLSFREAVEKDPAVQRAVVPDFTPYVLAETMWPFTHTKYETFKLPAALQPTYDKLQEMYQAKHQGRQLKWLWNLCRVELKANLSKPGKPPFIFSMHLLQMAVLFPFNERETYTFAELQAATGLDLDHLEGYLAAFVKHRLLAQSPAATMGPETAFTVVKEYKSKKLKVNFATTLKTEAKQESDDAQKEIDEDRKIFLQACIVRIMKARKTSKHGALINEVIHQSHARFHAAISDIKKCIDVLIEKQYLRRVAADEYEYMA
ncbi:hypothetical protein BABINDRAFT_162668 [Babjeviella inositovora NRRL Y-12698]|uniref:Cullin family profile domain-containing protein n=1 Tax=Babjeviella inositovora NRRL Y-12698 TaxID=984486 RepID=A0A1E3QL85_9ASCO|nr:uncharacterized protein BABINDRAFT_162668 [Babjeviella inositovora NRRL Y-12698]ODQ78445.1 hypothetical protein BABINDRAFT_162668 [Babjeviella inositovora NRRL Y-12698]